jgi:chorismate dehydratase
MPVVAAVSFLNAVPLVDGLDAAPEVVLRRAVPSRLTAMLERGEADVALCPTIDFQRSRVPLEIVPCGGIASRSTTHTVRLFSRRPIPTVERIAVDSDSHTSVALLAVVLDARWGRRPALVPIPGPAAADASDAVLLIGDKVVTCEPPSDHYRYQLDLGEAWQALTGMPFVFAAWMARAGADLEHLPGLLDATRRRNCDRLRELAAAHAAALGWPPRLAHRYLSELLHYEIGERELASMEEFWRRCRRLGLIDDLRPLRLYPGDRRSTRAG